MYLLACYILIFYHLSDAQLIQHGPSSANLQNQTHNNTTDDKLEVNVVRKQKPANGTEKLVVNLGQPGNPQPPSEIEPGAVLRAVWVFVGLSLIFMAYIGIKTYRRRGRAIVVKKYGVRTRRSDIEMEPLPLEEDDDDETVFDLKTLNR